MLTGEIILTLKENFKIGVYKVKYIEPHHVLVGEYNPNFWSPLEYNKTANSLPRMKIMTKLWILPFSVIFPQNNFLYVFLTGQWVILMIMSCICSHVRQDKFFLSACLAIYELLQQSDFLGHRFIVTGVSTPSLLVQHSVLLSWKESILKENVLPWNNCWQLLQKQE